jgi:hypothetical protein
MASYPHLRLTRERGSRRRRTAGFPRREPPVDKVGFATYLLDSLAAAIEGDETTQRFDDRRLIRIQVTAGVEPNDFESIKGVEIVSQEADTVVLAFATSDALDIFESRLATMAKGREPTRAALLYAIKAFGNWTAEDRLGRGLALRGQGGELEANLVDVELWPIRDRRMRDNSLRLFEQWLQQQHIEIRDALKVDHAILYRLSGEWRDLAQLLEHRDVRTVELPPVWAIDRAMLSADIADIGDVEAPPEDAESVVILDSGITANHPLLGPAIGEAVSFLQTNSDPTDDHGHGTHVAGIALYGDIAACIGANRFEPSVRLYAGRVLDEAAEYDELMEKMVTEAVRYFKRQYGCRVFNLSLGDRNRPFDGGHVRTLATTLDELSREEGVLFVVAAGNYTTGPSDWRQEYPGYLSTADCALLDPATAINAITVGSLARWELPWRAQANPRDPNVQPIARMGEPSPFTRSGPSVNKAVKPDVVAYGGNWSWDVRSQLLVTRDGLGEVSTDSEFVATGRLFGQECGTSAAAPAVAHIAARLWGEMAEASSSLIRAMLAAHASVPEAARAALGGSDELVTRLCGYGMVDESSLYRSTDSSVTMYAEERIENNRNQFFEVPLPDEFVSGGRRVREVTVALAYCPVVRNTRLEYRATRLWFRLVPGRTIEEVASAYDGSTPAEDYDAIGEVGSGRGLGPKARSGGTLQACTWKRKQLALGTRWFVVVTRRDLAWAKGLTMEEEPYAIVIRLQDQEAVASRLYAAVRAAIQARIRLSR